MISILYFEDSTMVKEALPSWVHQDSEEGLVNVNVGGLKRSLCSSTLKKFPDTRLGKLLACDSEEDILQVGPNALVGGTQILRFPLLIDPPLSYRCVTTTMYRRRSFILIGILVCSLMCSTFTRLANFT